MSIVKTVALVSVCILLAGCAPISSIQSIIALGVALLAAVGAAWGITTDRDVNRVCLKAQELDKEITAHEEKYHRSLSKDTVVALNPANKSNGATALDTESNLNQRM